jgi:hypothetical protein
MEKRRLGISLTRRWVSVDFPEPEGAEIMKTVVIKYWPLMNADER